MHRHMQMGHRGAFVAPSDTIQQPEITLEMMTRLIQRGSQRCMKGSMEVCLQHHLTPSSSLKLDLQMITSQIQGW